jgi:hypothetical protein
LGLSTVACWAAPWANESTSIVVLGAAGYLVTGSAWLGWRSGAATPSPRMLVINAVASRLICRPADAVDIPRRLLAGRPAARRVPGGGAVVAGLLFVVLVGRS